MSNPSRSDQASRLRELASPDYGGVSLPETNGMGFRNEPRVVLISEFPSLVEGFSLAWHLSRCLQATRQRSAIIDLAPAASRLPGHLKQALHSDSGSVPVAQPWWCDTALGKTLSRWHPSVTSATDVIAQPAGSYPTLEQMPRLCEQLLRWLSQGRAVVGSEDLCAWGSVVLLSEIHGVPLDQACWAAADEIILLLPDNQIQYVALAQAALAARLPRPSAAQRVIAIWKRERQVSIWPLRSRLVRRRSGGCMLAGPAENFCLDWPATTAGRARSSRRTNRLMAKLGWLVAEELRRVSWALPRQPEQETRQAS